MKYMIVSDIHGDAVCTEKFLQIFEKECCEKLIILGDILYHGPRNDLPQGYNPKKVIAALNLIKEKIIAVRGNCDAEVDEMVLDFPIQADPQYININGKEAILTHGHKFDFDEKGKLLLHGHTHILRAEKTESGMTVVNPGSTSIPKGDNPKSFAILNDRCLKIYDFDMKVIKVMEI